MIFVDRREGSHDLLKPLQARGLPATLTELAYGDIAFEGRGERGQPVEVGVELKQLGDMVTSLRSGRLVGHQLDGLLKTYDYRWLVVEGRWRVNRYGQLVQFKGPARGWRALHGGMTGAELIKKCLTLQLRGGLYLATTNTRLDTVQFLETLYHWWTDRDLDEHRSHIGIHNPHGFLRVSETREALMKWPGVGLRVSKAAEEAFGSIRRASHASVDEWAKLTTTDDKGHTRRFGMKAAERVIAFCEGKQ